MDEAREIAHDRMTDLKHFCNAIERNDISQCRAILLPMSKTDITTLVNSELDVDECDWSPVTPFHVAADADVQTDIWNLLLPWGKEDTICAGHFPPLLMLITYYKESEREDRFSGALRVKPQRQLQKMRSWLEVTKTSTSKTVQRCKKDLLCELCQFRGGRDPDDASLEDIKTLAKDMIEKYDTDISLIEDEAYCPVHWAMENDNICFLSLFLACGKADANCLNEHGLTPLSSHACNIKSVFFLPCVGLLLEHGARLNAETKNCGFKAFHNVLLRLTPKQLDIFMTKYHRLWTVSVKESTTLPPVHGLMVYALSRSGIDDRLRMQLDILAKIKVLLEYGLQLGSRDLNGRTILHYACWLKYSKISQYLISVGSNPYDKDTFGRCCLYYAISQPFQNYEILSSDEYLPTLEVAVSAVDAKATEILDNLGRSALHLACFENNATALEYLLKRGFDINMRDSEGKTVLDYADISRNECSKVIKEFVSKASGIKATIIETEIIQMFEAGTPSKEVYVKNTEKEANEMDTRVTNNFDEPNADNNKRRENNVNLEEQTFKSANSTSVKNTLRNKSVGVLLNDLKNVVLENNKIRHILIDMHILVNKIAQELGNAEPRFLANIELAGSVSEGTKLKPPNEFDFQFHLMAVSQSCVIEELFGNLVQLTVNTSHDSDLIKDMLHPTVSLNEALFSAFHIAVYKVLSNEGFWQNLPFHWYCHNMSVSMTHKKAVGAMGTLTAPFHLRWAGPQEPDINISVDLVPVIVMEQLPEAILEEIPDEVISFVEESNMKWHVVCRRAKYARLSFFAVERWILCRLLPELRKAYTLAKAVSKYCCDKLGCEAEYITSYMLKNALFYELDPDISYSLLDDQIVPYQTVSDCQKLVLVNTKSYFRKCLT